MLTSLSVLVCLAQAGAVPDPAAALAGVWKGTDVTLTLEHPAGTGTVLGVGDVEALRWHREKTGPVILELGDERVTCLPSSRGDSLLCRGAQARWPFLKKEGWKPTPPPKLELAPCTIIAVEGKSAGPVKLGMTVTQLSKLGLGLRRGVPTREFMSAGPYRVQLGVHDEAVAVRIDAERAGQLCLSGPKGSSVPFGEFRTGGMYFDVQSGVRGILDDRTQALAWVEIFPAKALAAAAPDACDVRVVPGVLAGPLRLGMTRDQATRLGLGLQTYPGRSTLWAGPYAADFDAAGTISSISVNVADETRAATRACLDSQPLSKTWHRDELCSRGFCACTVTRGSPMVGVAFATCPEGIVFKFGWDAPGELFGIEVRRPAARSP